MIKGLKICLNYENFHFELKKTNDFILFNHFRQCQLEDKQPPSPSRQHNKCIHSNIVQYLKKTFLVYILQVSILLCLKNKYNKKVHTELFFSMNYYVETRESYGDLTLLT